MRLLKRREVITKLKNKEIFNKVRVEKAVEEGRKTLTRIASEYEDRKSELQRNFDSFLIKINNKKEQLLEEVGVLESRKATALEPLERYEEELYETEKRLKQEEEDFKEIKVKHHKKERLLEKEEKKILEKACEIQKKEEEIGQKIQEANIRRNNSIALEEESRKKLDEVERDITDRLKEIQKKEEEVQRRSNLSIKEKEQLKIANELLKEREFKLEEWQKQLRSKEQSLKAIYASPQFKMYSRHSGDKN